ncbi:hypothetical protein KIPB_012022, partial [Kipferlia bialata]|eukprot:g12022.t1
MQDQDGVDYAAFVNLFSDAMHAAGLELQIDVFSWDKEFINSELLAKTRADRIITMDTYCGTFDPTFINDLNKNVNWYGTERLGMGLESVNPNNGQLFSDEDMEERFDLMTE